MIKKLTIDKEQLLKMLSGSTAIIGPEDLEARINSLPCYSVYPEKLEISSYLWLDTANFKFMLSNDVAVSNKLKYTVLYPIHELFLNIAKLNNPDVDIEETLRKGIQREHTVGVLNQIDSWSDMDWFKNAVHQFDTLFKEYIGSQKEG